MVNWEGDVMLLKGMLYRTVADVDYSTCIKCGLCARACPTKAINWAPKSYPIINLKLCTGCSLCVGSCPRGSVRMVRRFSVLPIALALSLLVILAVAVYAMNMATTSPVVESVEEHTKPIESWYEKYKESIWRGEDGEAPSPRDPISAPSGG